MEYEVVELPSKSMVGVTARTRNSAPDMGQIIGGLWERYFNEIGPSIRHKANACAMGLYSDYDTDENGEYSITVGCEVSKADDIPAGTVLKHIPPGKYAKFAVALDSQTAVQAFWRQLWDMPLNRTYSGDFEECVSDPQAAMMHVYIAIQ